MAQAPREANASPFLTPSVTHRGTVGSLSRGCTRGWTSRLTWPCVGRLVLGLFSDLLLFVVGEAGLVGANLPAVLRARHAPAGEWRARGRRRAVAAWKSAKPSASTSSGRVSVWYPRSLAMSSAMPLPSMCALRWSGLSGSSWQHLQVGAGGIQRDGQFMGEALWSQVVPHSTYRVWARARSCVRVRPSVGAVAVPVRTIWPLHAACQCSTSRCAWVRAVRRSCSLFLPQRLVAVLQVAIGRAQVGEFLT